MKLAIVHKEKCKPTACGHECKKYCPVEKKELDTCITISDKARIEEDTCIGCAICVKRCPFDAIDIINLPSVKESDMVYRYGSNGFALYGIPTPKEGSILGLLGRNGIGKSTAIKILTGQTQINLGKEATEDDIKEFFKGNEMLRYFEDINKKKISYKPQNLSNLAVDVKVIDLLKKRGKEKEIKELAKTLNITNVLENKMNKLSGGELQRVAIIAASLGDADIYFFDEPLAFLDISERLRVSDFLKELSKHKTLVVVEHDLLILDYLTEHINIFFGSQGAFGIVSGVKTSKYAVNSYLHGFLKEENLRIRDKALNFNFTKNPPMTGAKIAEWPEFNLEFESGFKLHVPKGGIRQNHVIGILGRNGTGKTSFVRAIAGELEVTTTRTGIPSKGDSKESPSSTGKGKLDLELDISYKPQYLFTESNEVVREIMFKEKINKKMAGTFNLGTIQMKKLSQLSGGELQRFSIARCLAKEADIYLIDEPSAYLDVEERISVAKAIKDIMIEKEKTAFVVDHDLLLISYLADSIINFSGEAAVKGEASEIRGFEEGVSELLKSLDITLRKEEESGRPRINSRGSVKDREQKHNKEWAVF
ncbi:MAG: ribosome biogenesis/translation initiation ATPase RLI [archaeon]|nr:ribosome biogenesis/translation initiation ATPase RLI [archaeon]MCR4323729.1 ribosome biogenesis/translation initiation ATPase RLI [Nanoarchaeota archaeon]